MRSRGPKFARVRANGFRWANQNRGRHKKPDSASQAVVVDPIWPAETSPEFENQTANRSMAPR